MTSTNSPWENFSYKELKCKCGKCGSNGTEMNTELMDALQRLRDKFGKPLIITSAYRCPNHPVERNKANPKAGAHVLGVAVDISIRGADAVALLKLAFEDPVFVGFGISQKGASRFIHLDSGGGNLPRPMIWSY